MQRPVNVGSKLDAPRAVASASARPGSDAESLHKFIGSFCTVLSLQAAADHLAAPRDAGYLAVRCWGPMAELCWLGGEKDSRSSILASLAGIPSPGSRLEGASLLFSREQGS